MSASTTQPFNTAVPSQTPERNPPIRNTSIDAWLTTQVLPAYDALKANPSRAMSVENIRTRLAKEHAKAS